MSTDTEYQPINCDDYEYLEIACQRQLKLEIKLHGGEIIEGKASDLLLRKKVEYLILETQDGTKSFVWIISTPSVILRSALSLSIALTKAHTPLSPSTPLMNGHCHKGLSILFTPLFDIHRTYPNGRQPQFPHLQRGLQE